MHPAVKVIGGIAIVGTAALAGAVFGVALTSYEITSRLSYQELSVLVKDEVVGPIIESAMGLQDRITYEERRRAQEERNRNRYRNRFDRRPRRS